MMKITLDLTPEQLTQLADLMQGIDASGWYVYDNPDGGAHILEVRGAGGRVVANFDNRRDAELVALWHTLVRQGQIDAAQGSPTRMRVDVRLNRPNLALLSRDDLDSSRPTDTTQQGSRRQ